MGANEPTAPVLPRPLTCLPPMLTYDMGVTLQIHTAGHLPAFSYALLQNCQIFVAVPWWLIILPHF